MSIRKIKQIQRQIEELEIEKLKEASKTFPMGSRTYHNKGGSRVWCTIIGHAQDRLKVESESGKEYWIYLNWFLDA